MAMQFIDLAAQRARIQDELDRRMSAVLDHGRFIMGPEVKELEASLSDYVGGAHCIAVANGTDALQVAMLALGIGPGDEVITTPFTFIATGEMISLVGAKPVFVDIDPETYNLDPAGIESAITDRTKAIIPVSLYGQCADFDAINAIASKHGIPVIEDAAQSFGAEMHGRKSCDVSDIATTSFFPSKPLGCYGDGGAVLTRDDALAEKVRQLRVHGQDRRYHHPLIGVNSRLDTLQAAILLAKMTVFADEVEKRGTIGARYSEMLDGVVRTPVIRDGFTSVYAQYTIEVPDREAFVASLKEQGIPTAVHYPIPLHMQPAFSSLGQGEGAFPVAEKAARHVVSLPMHPYLSEEDQGRVVEAVKQALG